MGAGRKTESVVLQSKTAPQQTSNRNPCTARGMRKNDLAAVIFGCKHNTINECKSKQLFGLPSSHIKYVQYVTPGMPLFLFNYSDRKLHGIYEATSRGQLSIDPYAWTLDGEVETLYPAQVRVKVRLQCRALREEQFKPVLAENYSSHEPNHFWFELDQAQTNKLISLFAASPLSQNEVGPMAYQEDCNSKVKQKIQPAADQDVGEKHKNVASSSEGKQWSSLFKSQSDSTLKKEDEKSNSEVFSNMSEDETLTLSEAIHVDEAPPMPGVPQVNESPVVSEVACIDEAPIQSELICFTGEISSESNSTYHTGINKLIIQAIEEVKAFQLNQTRKIQSLEQNLIEAKERIRELENCHWGSGKSIPPQSTGHVEELQFNRTSQDSCHSILLVGGFSGSSWLRDLDLYMPSEDVLQSLEPMTSVRPYASVVKLKDALYVLGGGYSTSWYDTVESYNLKTQQWMSFPPLNKKKGSLGAVSFCDKIYAIGGGNASDCFSEVEMLDLDIGNWVLTRSMGQKRFGPAAAQINGVLYVVGGYDGSVYLGSMERFDPREYSWTGLKSMTTRRGCHSLTVLDEKLYAIGGYDGAQMVPTVEVFEPRVGSWTMLEPMKYARGYMGTVTLGNTIYVISGMQENEEILDTVECYSEGKGWQLANMKSIGKRCFFSALAV
ncbi:uncharacterized protein LOC104905945 [Beta vulgaris subsp. vulgaris]|uniref:uncharacterized protein LOC104905945 n=1 Tax=Beta vulgaris subsp. vulgaris TaxID=3555 RepID=UPI002037477D|nr:uncharacterized protein LOC104905945 [Beta vulgaris subsp. vulgaris]